MSGLDIRQFEKQQKQASKDSSIDLKKLLDQEINLFPVKFSDKLKESFYLELSTLLMSGLDIKSALELIEEEQVKPKHAGIIRQVKEDLINGDSLWEAMKKSSHFTPYEYFSIQIGEETGKIDIVLSQLNAYYTTLLKQRRQFISTLSYPVIILLTSIGAVGFMLLFIVPMFSDVFKRFGGELPFLTRIIIQVSDAVQSYFLVLFSCIGALVMFFYLKRKETWFKKYSAKLVSKIPVIGKIVHAIQMARFCSSMGLLLGSKVPMLRSIDLVSQMVTYYPLQLVLEPVSNNVMNGVSLHVSLGKYPIFNKKMVSLIKVGEEVNKLDVFFEKLSKQYSTDVDHQTGLLNTFLEPAMIIFLGGVVGFILLAMYMPMFQLSTSIGG
ncbi:MAG TPA: type II secretion system F family protein [Ohtaekwangia sp.]|nr:type II secretion system F family protein [Ohtaekwangia sp.]